MVTSEDCLRRAEHLLREAEKSCTGFGDTVALADGYVKLAAEVAKQEMRQRMIRDSRRDRRER
jgi:hypothetical protein